MALFNDKENCGSAVYNFKKVVYVLNVVTLSVVIIITLKSKKLSLCGGYIAI